MKVELSTKEYCQNTNYEKRKLVVSITDQGYELSRIEIEKLFEVSPLKPIV